MADKDFGEINSDLTISGGEAVRLKADESAFEVFTPSATINAYPQRATMWHDEATVTNGNALTHAMESAHPYQTVSWQNASAINDAFSHSFFLKAGTYEFTVLGYTSLTLGQVDWSIDGNLIASNQDWYSGGVVKNVRKTVSSVTVTGDGYHKLTGVVDSKNGASGGYDLLLTKYWFWVASDDPARA